MTPSTRTRLSLAVITSLALAASPLAAQSIEALRQGFLSPPPEARPMVRWWWFGAAVVKPEILRELQQMKADGIGGAELAFVYPEVLDDPAKDLKNLPFLSPEMLDAVTYAQSEGRKLGLRIDVTLCSGWPYGGPNTTLADASTRLRIIELPVPAKSTKIPTPTVLSLPVREGHIPSNSAVEGDKLIGLAIGNGEPKHWNAADMQMVTSLDVAPSTTPRVALLFYMSHTFQQVKRAAVGAEGYVLDPFSKQAVATHLAKVGDPLVKAFGSTPPYAIFSDSLEAYGADWTPVLPDEFKKRRGYDLIPHLPELVAGGTPAADKVRHDYGRTLTELVNENYLTQIDDWAKSHGTKFRSQTYGEPAVSLSSQRLVALPEGEGPQWRAFSTLRWASSGNHLFGNNVTSGETYTWLHSPVFRATPLDMKAEADIDFIMGENQLIFHGWPYSAPGVPEPGWSLYAATSMNDHNPWHPVMPAVTQYISRLSWLLRQGKPANQVAVLLPTDDAWASFAPGKVTVTGAMQKLIPKEMIAAIESAGYNFDFIDADTINKQGIGDYQVLLLPPTDRIPVETLKKIGDWRKEQYAISNKREYDVICYLRCPSVDPDGKPLPGMTGSFLIADNLDTVTKDMHDVAVPDLRIDGSSAESQVGFIRRRLPNADIFVVANTSNKPIVAPVSFASAHKFVQQWNPDTGIPGPVRAVHKSMLVLAPYESNIFLLYDDDNGAPQPLPDKNSITRMEQDISTDWRVNFTGAAKSVVEPTLKDWTAVPATLHYSGEAVYSRDFTLEANFKGSTILPIEGGSAIPGAPNSEPEEHVTRGADGMPNPLVTGTGPGMKAWFDPPLHEAALVTINGQPAGALWHPPYRLDITRQLKPGENHIDIHVFNTALNAWSALPPHDYGPLKAKYGDRFQMQDLDKVKPIPSGIIGTVKLVTQDPQ